MNISIRIDANFGGCFRGVQPGDEVEVVRAGVVVSTSTVKEVRDYELIVDPPLNDDYPEGSWLRFKQ
jgi:hypothetical protein